MSDVLTIPCRRLGDVRVSVAYGNDAPSDSLDDWRRSAHPWTITVETAVGRESFHYWTGELAGEARPDEAFAHLYWEARLAGSSDILAVARNYRDDFGEDPSDELAAGLADIYRRLDRIDINPDYRDEIADWIERVDL